MKAGGRQVGQARSHARSRQGIGKEESSSSVLRQKASALFRQMLLFRPGHPGSPFRNLSVGKLVRKILGW
eukprot:13454896-Heterocapsa_arctica.AAC.1